MGLGDVLSGKQSLGSWLTGRDPNESYVAQNTEKVEATKDLLNKISTDTITTAKDEVYAAFERLNSIPGMADYIGTLDASQFDQYFTSIAESVTGLSDTLQKNADDIIAYDKAAPGVKVAATLGMVLAKPTEGFLSVFEALGDGVLSAVGFVSGAIPFVGKDIQKGISNVIEANWSHDIFQYDKWAKYSAITEDSAIGNGLRIAGKVGGYIAGGYLAAGALGLSTTATYGAGLLKATGATWGGAAFAAATGVGSGTEEALQLGADYNQAFLHGLGQGAKQGAFAFAAGAVMDRLTGAINNGPNGGSGGSSGEGATNTARNVGENADEAANSTARNVGENIDDAANSTARNVGENIDDAANSTARNVGENIDDAANSTARNVGENIDNAANSTARNVGENIDEAANSTARNVGENIDEAANSTSTALATTPRNVANSTARNVGENIDEAANSTARNVGQNVDNAASSTARNVGQNVDDAASSTARNVGQNVDEAANTAARNVGQNTDDIANGAASESGGLRQSIASKLSGAREKVGDIAGTAKEKAGSLVGSATKPFKYVAENGGIKGIAANGGLSGVLPVNQTAGGLASEIAGAAANEIHEQRIKPEIDTYNNINRSGLADKMKDANPIADAFTAASGTPTPPTTGGGGTPTPPTTGGGGTPPTTGGGGGGGGNSGGGGGGGNYSPYKPGTPAQPTTAAPTTAQPTTAAPTTAQPTTAAPTTAQPTTATPTTASPTTGTTTYTVRPSATPGGGGNNGGSYTGYVNTQPSDAHSGVEYNGSEAQVDSLELENAEELGLLEDVDVDNESSINDVVNSNKYNKIPTSSTPIQTKKNSSNSVVPIAVGLSVASAAGIGAKAYIDHKRNNEVSDDEYDEDYDDFESEEWSGDEDTVDIDYSNSTAENEYLEEDNFYQDEDSGYSARNASELAELQ